MGGYSEQMVIESCFVAVCTGMMYLNLGGLVEYEVNNDDDDDEMRCREKNLVMRCSEWWASLQDLWGSWHPYLLLPTTRLADCLSLCAGE